ncbi:UDP-glycosyltransferase 83A1-like [Olea europaea var. sylvestris]|uniref:UDP-glycosyltransferase 83A1-like n=1 Tax=Olea europaea var. sylvestris TaxID=158386 RepID=UPI000C1D0CCA|nr:UDP-glycosyltransferase 83A1-like [Olea europaea var. sylvestris]
MQTWEKSTNVSNADLGEIHKCHFCNYEHVTAMPRANAFLHLEDKFGRLDVSIIGEAAEALLEAIATEIINYFQKLIERINGSESDKISCIIAETSLGWAIEIAEKMGIKKVAFWPAASALFAQSFKIPSLIDEGIIDSEGTPMKNQIIQLSQAMPPMKTTDFFWNCFNDEVGQKLFFKLLVKNMQLVKSSDRLICNSSNWLEPGTFASFPNFLPIGPLLASNRLGNSAGNFWQQDSGCLLWLDQQQRNSVIYVAFGSSMVFDQNQFKELALSLELTKRPFLWVVRENTAEDVDNAYPIGFRERVRNWGRIVAWAPQQNVLSHPSIACFISHCGWNSTIEGISNGVPFLCWPYFSDQMFNQSYICDYLKIGLKLNKDEGGIIRHEEIYNKLEQLLGDERFKELALDLQSNVLNSVREGGSSYNNFKDLVAWIKD